MKIKISNSFLIISSLMIAINGIKLFVFVLLSCLIHEFAHILSIKAQNLRIEQFDLNFVGGSIKCHSLKNQNNFSLIIVYSIGIVFNFLLGFLCNYIAINGFYSRNFFILSGINFLLACFNALPIKILDGYFVLKHFLLMLTKNNENVIILCDIISFTFNILLIIFGIYYFFKFNFSILLISIYLLISSLKN